MPSPHHSAKFDVVAIGASAGGFNALVEVLRGFSGDLPSSVLVVQHLDRRHKSVIADLLGRKTAIPVKLAEHGERMLPGIVYIAPPDEHLLAGPGKLQLAHSQLVNFLRPSIDLLFESVAGTYGSHCIGVVLSGTGKDGSAGIRAIKQAGGVTLAQDPNRCEFCSMPQAAVATGCVDFVLPLEALGARLTSLCNGTGDHGRRIH